MDPSGQLQGSTLEVCIVGIGTSEQFGFDVGKSPISLQVEAFGAALQDANMTKCEIDGVATAHGSPLGVDYDEFAAIVGLECRYVNQTWSHGRWTTSLILHGALAIAAGFADAVAVCNTVTSRRGYGRHLTAQLGGSYSESNRDVGGGHGEWLWSGTDSPASATALTAQRYMEKYGASELDLANVAIGLRKNAQFNPMAILRDKPLDHHSYLMEPKISGPFRRSDHSLVGEGSTCLILTSSDRANDLDNKVVKIAGAQGLRTSRDDFVTFSRPGLGVGFGEEYPYEPTTPPVYAMAGVASGDIDGLYTYDAFSSNLWMTLERFGICTEGEAPALIAEQGIGIESKLPINSHGGLMSEAHLFGYSHIVEMVRQLRGNAGSRQIRSATVLQWATPWGDSLILTN